LGALKKAAKNVGQESLCAFQDSNWGPCEHKSKALQFEPFCSVRYHRLHAWISL